MKIYLSAAFDRAAEIRPLAAEAEANGHEVVSRWLDPDEQARLFGRTDRVAEAAAYMDLDDIDRADAFVLFTEPTPTARSSGGHHFEAGYACTLGIPMMTVGPRENVFYHLPGIRNFETWALCLSWLNAFDNVDAFIHADKPKSVLRREEADE